MVINCSNWVDVKKYISSQRLKLVYTLSIVVLSSFMLSSCEKEEGYGGLASISGKVYAHEFDKNGKETEGYIGEVVVYLGTESSSEIIDRIRTKHDGSYKFNMLRKGEYEVWVYSDCNNCPGGQKPEIQKVKIDSKKSHVELDDFVIEI